MKKFKNLSLFICAAILSCACVGFAACGDDEEDTSTETSTSSTTSTSEEEDDSTDTGDGETAYYFEAELTLITDDMEGLGASGSPTGLSLIAESSEASNGYYVGQLGQSSPITYTITSDSDVTVTLRGVFGSNNLGTVTWTYDEFNINVNGEAFAYNSFETSIGTSSQQNFKTRTLGTIDLVEGENTIVLVAGTNTYLNNLSSAPSIDCLIITTSATLEMDEYPENLD